MSLTLTSTHLSYVARSTHLLNISSYYIVPGTDGKDEDQSNIYYKSIWEVDGYEWEIRLYPVYGSRYQVELQLVSLGEAGANRVTAALSCRMVDPSGRFEPSEEKTSETTSFQHRSDSSQPLVVPAPTPRRTPSEPGRVGRHVHRLRRVVSRAQDRASREVPGLHGRVLRGNAGEELGQEMEAPVFGAMLRFIYTDAVAELDGKPPEAATATATTTLLAQHLLVAADRYGLDRLRVMCERRLAFAVDVGSVAATLVIAERHGCSWLKAKCIEFIAGGSRENLHAVL
ncbi:unnamed protein product [Miscanthus lutarioriparius]|uniref:BPM/SPOP BACK domain-containing protein n=1 Tax=Miscanthus lutarioriparius TaxID=422564 RepID=A0A811RC35_9POAL|nr:unnamed protein product [Miscanthus lutarioriparius]